MIAIAGRQRAEGVERRLLEIRVARQAHEPCEHARGEAVERKRQDRLLQQPDIVGGGPAIQEAAGWSRVRPQQGAHQLFGEHRMRLVTGGLVEIEQRRGGVHLIAQQAAGGVVADVVRQPVTGTVHVNEHALERLRAALTAQFDYLARHPDLVSLLTHGSRIEEGVFAPAIKRLVVPLAEGQGLGQVRGDIDPHVAAAQALVLMLGYLRLEPVIAASAPTLTGDAPALRARWMRAAIDLFLGGVRAA